MPPGFLGRLGAAVHSPGDLASRLEPRYPWLAAVVLLTAIDVAGTWTIWRSPAGVEALRRSETEVVELARARLTPARFDAFIATKPDAERRARNIALAQLPRMLLSSCLLAVLLNFTLNVLWLDSVRFTAILSVVVHASAVSMLGLAYVVGLTYLTTSVHSAPTSGALLGFAIEKEAATAAAWLSNINPFTIWWLIVVGIASARVYRRRTSWLPAALVAFYVLVSAVAAYLAAGRVEALAGAHL